jgi:transposase
MSQKLNSAIAVIGIDIGKNSFHVIGQDRRGAIVLRQKWSRGQVEARLANLPPCLIGNLQSQCGRTALRSLPLALRRAIPECYYLRNSRHYLLDQLQPLRGQVDLLGEQSGDVATRPREASDGSPFLCGSS